MLVIVPSVRCVPVSVVDVVDVVAVLDGRVAAARAVLVPVRLLHRVVQVGLGHGLHRERHPRAPASLDEQAQTVR